MDRVDRFFDSYHTLDMEDLTLPCFKDHPLRAKYYKASVTQQEEFPPMEEGAKIGEADLNFNSNVVITKTKFGVSGIIFDRVPQMPAVCPLNEYACLRNRVICVKQPYHRDIVEEFLLYIHTVWEKVLFGDTKIRDVRAMVFENYAARFPKKKANMLWRGLEETNYDGNFSALRSAFVKLEKKIKTLLDSAGKYLRPRLIQAASPEQNSQIGPWIKAFTDVAKSIMNEDHWIFYTPGSDCTTIGQYVEDAFTEEILEDDFSAYDLLHPYILKFENYIYEQCGCPPDRLKYLKKQLVTRGYTRSGIYYACRGNRKSGDPQTSIGNSMDNAMVHAFAIWKTFGVHIWDFGKMCVCGDDNLILPRKTSNRFGQVADVLRQLGFRPKMVVKRDLHKANYCSCTFLPGILHGERVMVLSPCVAKSLLKMGYTYTRINPDKFPVYNYCIARGMLNFVNHVPCLSEAYKSMLRIGKPATSRGERVVEGWS